MSCYASEHDDNYVALRFVIYKLQKKKQQQQQQHQDMPILACIKLIIKLSQTCMCALICIYILKTTVSDQKSLP